MNTVDFIAALLSAGPVALAPQETFPEVALGFDQALAERIDRGEDRAAGEGLDHGEGQVEEPRPHGRRGLPVTADVREMLDRLARRWAAEVVSPFPSVNQTGAGVGREDSGDQVQPRTEGPAAVRDPAEAVVSTALATIVPREPKLPLPEAMVFGQAVAELVRSAPAEDVEAPTRGLDTRTPFTPGDARGRVAAADPGTAQPADGPSATIDHRSSTTSPYRTAVPALVPFELSRPDVGVRRPLPALESLEPRSKVDVVRVARAAYRRDELTVAGEAAPRAPVPPTAPVVPVEGAWIQSVREALHAATGTKPPIARPVIAEPVASTAPPLVDADPRGVREGQQPVSQGGIAASDAALATAEVPPARRRSATPVSRQQSVMFEAVRATIRAAAAQASTLGTAVEPNAPTRVSDLRRASVAVVASAIPVRQAMSDAFASFASVAASATTHAESLESGAQSELATQIVQAIRLQWGSDGGDVRLRLQPQYLGELTVSLKVDQGSVTAHLEASTPEVRKWIETNEALLRQGLATHDLRLDRLVVTEQDAAPSSADAGDQNENGDRPTPQRRRPRPHDEDATFEVVV